MPKINDKEMMVISVIALVAWPFVMAEKIILETCQNLGFIPVEKSNQISQPPQEL
jgi:hypothetical protein